MSSAEKKKARAIKIAAFILMPLFFSVIVIFALVLLVNQLFGGYSVIKLFISDTAIEAATVRFDGVVNMFDEQPGIVASEDTVSTVVDTSSDDISSDVSAPEVSDIVIDRYSFAWPTFASLYAYIDVPQLGVKDINLYWGSTAYTRKHGVAHSTDSFLPGYGRTVLLVGHCTNYFAFLEEIEVGHLVTLRTYYGTYVYRVTSSELIDKDDADRYNEIIAQKEKEMLVMYTCYPFSKLWTDQRMVVFCEKVSGPVLG